MQRKNTSIAEVQMTSFRDGPKSGEKTRQMAFPKRAELLLGKRSLEKCHRSKLVKSTPKNIFKKHPGKLDRDIGGHRTAPAPLCAISHIEGSSTPQISRLRCICRFQTSLVLLLGIWPYSMQTARISHSSQSSQATVHCLRPGGCSPSQRGRSTIW